MTNYFSNVKKKIVHKWSVSKWPVRTIFLLLCLAFVSVVLFYFTAVWRRLPDGQSAAAPAVLSAAGSDINAVPAHYIRRALDGVYTEPAAASLYPVAVMIDNDPLSRPQSGLARASLVYEANAESGITRFLAVFAQATTTPDIIGPIRSARPYFVDWARGLGALYVHVGGSPEALTVLKSISLINLNEFYQSKYFWRSAEKTAPHNVYGRLADFYIYLDKLNAASGSFDSWQYKDEDTAARCGAPESFGCQNIAIDYSVRDFLVEWRYNSADNNYTRFLAGAPHGDADGRSITAKNIVVMQVKTAVIDSELRRRLDTVGGGEAWYCLDGYCRTGVWKKSAAERREKIYNHNGEEARFNAGTTWVQVVENMLSQVAVSN